MPGLYQVLNAFLLGFPSLFSIVNPISGAFIFREVTADRSQDRSGLAGQVALYSLVVMSLSSEGLAP
jgi:multiple antibiotic resistance protein